MKTKTKQKNNIPKLRFPGFSGAWEEKRLGEVAEINPRTEKLPNSFIYIDLESVEKGVLRKENKTFLNSAPSRAHRLLNKKDILFQTVRPYQKNNLFFNKDGEYVASTGYAQIRTSESSDFIYQILHTDKFVNKVLARCTGTSYPAISSKDLGSIKISIPQKEEQRKIAGFLGVVDEKIEGLKNKKLSLEKYKKGIMQKIFPTQGGQAPEIRFKDENGKDYPNWEEKKLGEVGEIIMGQSPDSSSYNTDGIGKYLIQGNADIVGRETHPRNWASESVKECKQGDIIMTVRAPVGYVARSLYDACIGRGVCAIRNKKNSDMDFLYQFLLYFEKRWVKFEQGSTFTAVNTKDVKNLKLPVPSPEEQQKIALFLSSLDSKVENINKELTSTQKFKKGLLQWLFV